MDFRILYTSPIDLPKVLEPAPHNPAGYPGLASQKVREHAEEPFRGATERADAISGQASPRAASASGVRTSYDLLPETEEEDEMRRLEEPEDRRRVELEKQQQKQAEEAEQKRKMEEARAAKA